MLRLKVLSVTPLVEPAVDSKAADNRAPKDMPPGRYGGSIVRIGSSTTCPSHLKSRGLDYKLDRLAHSSKLLTEIIQTYRTYNDCHNTCLSVDGSIADLLAKAQARILKAPLEILVNCL